MKSLILVLSLFLFGCTATQIQYAPNSVENKALATQIIEQVIMEQPLKYRPEGTLITEEYLAFGEGFVSKGSTVSNALLVTDNSAVTIGSTKVESKNIASRLYFNSLTGMDLFHKRDWYIVQLRNDENRIVRRFYTRNQNKAKRFIDAMSLYISTSKDFGGL